MKTETYEPKDEAMDMRMFVSGLFALDNASGPQDRAGKGTPRPFPQPAPFPVPANK